MDKVYTRFQTKRGKTLPVEAAHTNMAYVREYPPGFSQVTLLSVSHGY